MTGGNVIGLPTPEPERYLKREDVAEILQCSLTTVDRLCREEGLPHFKLGRKMIRFHPSAVTAWVNSRRAA